MQTETQTRTVSQTRTAEQTTIKSGAQSFDDALGCAKCYAKHLAKALVQWAEYREDRDRVAELTLCVGNLGCAEDHAAALGLQAEARRIRWIRNNVWDADVAVMPALQEMALDAMAAARAAVEGDKRKAAEAASSAAK